MTNLDELEALARAATPGEWSVDGYNLSGVIHRPHGSESVAAWKTLANCQTSNWKNDAAYIAAAHPTRVLSLIEEVRRMTDEIETIRSEAAGHKTSTLYVDGINVALANIEARALTALGDTNG